MEEENIPSRCKVAKIENEQFMSRKQYLKVISKDAHRVNFVTESGFTFNASNDIVEEAMLSADQFNTTETVSQTDMAQRLMDSHGDIFTVNFDKQATEKSINEKLNGADIATAKSRKALAKELRVGEQRTLVGYLIATEPILGRSKVIDLQQQFAGAASAAGAMRLVDHRSLNWMILGNVKYVKK